MQTEIWVAIIAGVSGIVGVLVSWWKDRNRDDASVTKMVRDMKKEALSDAVTGWEDIKALRQDMDDLLIAMLEMKRVLRELTSVIEFDVIPILPDHPITSTELELLIEKASKLTKNGDTGG